MTIQEMIPQNTRNIAFNLGGEADVVKMWLLGDRPKNVFFDEHLPACFERTLQFDQFRLDRSVFEWVFTGEKGGFTLKINDTSIDLEQRYYDSFGAYNPDDFFDQDYLESLTPWFEMPMEKVYAGEAPVGVYPQRKWFCSTRSRPHVVETLKIVLDHKMGLTLFVNDKETIRQSCLLDLSQHQLRLSDKQGGVKGCLILPNPVSASVHINLEHRHQTIIGFGGTAIPTAYAELSLEGRRLWWKLIAEYNLLIQRENPIDNALDIDMSNWDGLENATPHYYGDNFPNGNICDFEYNKKIRQLDGQVWFEFWNLPPWVFSDPEGIYVDEKNNPGRGIVDVQAYARAIVGYCKTSEQRTGVPPEIVGIQNENMQSIATYHAMTLTLRQALDHAGFSSVKIHMSDANMTSPHSAWGKLYADSLTRAKTFTQDQTVWDTIDYATTHMYDYQEYFNCPDEFDKPLAVFRKLTKDKPFLSTELGINNGRFQESTYRLALLMGELYHKNLVIANASALCYTWTIVNVTQPSFGWTRSLFVVDKTHNFVPVASSHQLRVFGAYSRRIRKDMIRVDAQTDNSDLLVSAFSDSAHRRTVILLNRSSVPQHVHIQGIDESFTYIELTDPYHENQIMPTSILHHSETSPSILVHPGAIVTLSNVPLASVPEHFDQP